MSNPKNANSVPHLPKTLSYALRGMLALAVLACIFVLVQSCSVDKKPSLLRFAKGDLKKLEVLLNPPAQPQMGFVTDGGGEMRLKDFRGKTVVLNIWATWCGPCIAEIPSLDMLQSQRGGPNFVVVTISMDRHIDDARAFLKTKNIDNLALYHDPSYSISAKLGVQGIPISVVYAPDGQELARIAGEVNWQGESATALLDHLAR